MSSFVFVFTLTVLHLQGLWLLGHLLPPAHQVHEGPSTPFWMSGRVRSMLNELVLQIVYDEGPCAAFWMTVMGIIVMPNNSNFSL